MARHLAIGDIHGCGDALETLLDCVQPADDDVVITLGDHINRGPSAYKVVETLIELEDCCELHCLRGNHEVMMLSAKYDELQLKRFLRVGGERTLDSYRAADHEGTFPDLIPYEHWQFFEDKLLPFFDTKSHFFVHANAYPDMPLEDQPDFMLYWESWNDPPMHESGKIMVCGHTSQKSGTPLFNGNAVCIDTFAHGGGWLSCLHVETGKIWQANEKRETRTLWLDELPTR